MTATVHYNANWAAEGGPPYNGPCIRTEEISDECTGPLHILKSWSLDDKWVATDAVGNVYVEADDPSDLAEWVATYLYRMGRMHRDGQA
jgi:hypothetical protein